MEHDYIIGVIDPILRWYIVKE